MDTISKEQRSDIMSRVRQRDTSPELLVRRGLHREGFRYRLYSKHMPGKPDLTFSKYKAVIFIHGCFWHGHGCGRTNIPKSNTEYWKKKITKNKTRDRRVVNELIENGWRVLIVWECATEGKWKLPENSLMSKITNWLKRGKDYDEVVGRSAKSARNQSPSISCTNL